MSDMIKNCFEDHGATLAREVYFEGERIATIRPLRPLDRDALLPWMGRLSFNGEEPVYDGVQPETLRLAKIVLSLGGELGGVSHRVDREGWTFERPVTLENVNLLREDILELLWHEITELDEEYRRNREAIRKNLPTPSGS